MDSLPLLEQLVVHLVGKNAVDDHSVRDVTEEAQVAERSLGLLDHHLLEVEDDAHRGGGGIRQHLAHSAQVEKQVLERCVNLIRWQWYAHHRLEDGPRHPHRPALPGIDLVEPPLGRVGECEQLQRLAGGRAVHDEDVVLGALSVVLDPHERGDLVHSRRIRDLVGHHLIEALRREHLGCVLVQLRPVTLHLMQGRHLVRPKVGGNRGEIRAELDIERVAE